MKEPFAIAHKSETCRFEAVIDGHVAYVAYELDAGILACAHTVVPTALGGRGVGAALVRHVLNYAAGQGYRVDPRCSFVRAYIDRHPNYQPLSLAHSQSS
ncbi:MAG: GNAT family N-acetyltransferase [Brachymonas sp.]